MHKRKYVPGATALRIGKIIHSRTVNRHDYVEQLVIDSGILDGAPFDTIYLHYYYGFKTDLKPTTRISKKYNDIRITIELDMDILEWADRYNIKLFMEMMMIGALEGLIHLGKKYKLKTALLEEERKEFRAEIPKTIEECKALPKLTMADYAPIRKYFRTDINVCANCFSAKLTPKARQCLACMEFHDPILITEKDIV